MVLLTKNKMMFFSLPKYLSPETILKGGGPSSDIWSLGIIMLELILGSLWSNLKPGPIMRRILTLVKANNPAERIAREHDALEIYKVWQFNNSNLHNLLFYDLLLFLLMLFLIT